MSTICWCPASGSAPVSVTPSTSDWDGHINTVQRPLNFTNGGTASTILNYAPDAADHLTDVASMIAAFVSQVLPPQTVAAQNVGFGGRFLESNTLNNLYLAWKLYGVSVDGASNLGTLKAISKFVGTEIPNAATGKAEIATISAVTFNVPWRLVLEVGADGLPTTGGGRHNFSIYAGETWATSVQLVQDGDTSVCPMILIFSKDLRVDYNGNANFQAGI
jgi:hypothetical protein